MKKEKINNNEVSRIAKEMNLREIDVYNAIEFQFNYVSETIKKPNIDSIRLKFLGLFRVKPRMVDKLIEKIEKENEQPLVKKE